MIKGVREINETLRGAHEDLKRELIEAKMPTTPNLWLEDGGLACRIGDDLMDQLRKAGTPKPINPAKELMEAVADLRDQGLLDDQQAHAIVHNQKVTIPNNWFNLIRNTVLLRHGIDMRTGEAQGLTLRPPTEGQSLAAQ